MCNSTHTSKECAYLNIQLESLDKGSKYIDYFIIKVDVIELIRIIKTEGNIWQFFLSGFPGPILKKVENGKKGLTIYFYT